MSDFNLNKIKFCYEEQEKYIRLFITYNNETVYINRHVKKNNTKDLIKGINELYQDIKLLKKEIEK